VKIIGCGGHARVVADIARAAGDALAGFLDDNFATAPGHLAVEGPTLSVLPHLIGTHRFAIGIGDAAARRALAEQVLAAGGELATLIHPSAIIAPDVRIGAGTVVMAAVTINTGSSVGRFAVINTGAVLDHDNVVEDNVQIAPGCTLAGTVTCQRDAFIGAGATIIPRIVVGAGAYVAAGATVIRPVRPHTLVAGCPAVEKRPV
jgi:acetyltransferase EpsM